MTAKIECSTCGELFIGEPPDWLCYKCWIVVGKRIRGEIMGKCDRCGKESQISTGSYFDTEQICEECDSKESRAGLEMMERCAKCGKDFTSDDPMESFCSTCWKALEEEVEGKLRKVIDPDDVSR